MGSSRLPGRNGQNKKVPPQRQDVDVLKAQKKRWSDRNRLDASQFSSGIGVTCSPAAPACDSACVWSASQLFRNGLPPLRAGPALALTLFMLTARKATNATACISISSGPSQRLGLMWKVTSLDLRSLIESGPGQSCLYFTKNQTHHSRRENSGLDQVRFSNGTKVKCVWNLLTVLN